MELQPESNVSIGNVKVSEVIGICIKRGTPWKTIMNMLSDARSSRLRMPCMFVFSIYCIPEGGLRSTPCPCGDPTHWLIKEVD